MGPFFWIGMFGLFFLTITAIGFDFDHDIDHGFDHGAGGDHGADVADSWWSLRVLSAFITGFGIAGWVATEAFLLPSIFGVGAGLFVGYWFGKFAKWLIRMLHRQQSNPAVSLEELLGDPARVSITIPDNGTGEIYVVFGRQRRSLLAVSLDGRIEQGNEVFVHGVEGSKVTVSRRPHPDFPPASERPQLP